MSEIDLLSDIAAVEELNISQRLIKKFFEEEQKPEKELKAYRKELEIPARVQVYGVEISVVRKFAQTLTKIYKNYDFPRFLKLVDILWQKDTSLEEHYLALLLIQSRKRELDEVDVCLDLWNWLWSAFKENVLDWSLCELIANTIGYQIIEAWSSAEDEESGRFWEDLKNKAKDDRHGNFGKVFAVLCPLKRINKLGTKAVLPTLEVILSAIAKFEREEKEVNLAMERAMMLTMRECAKTDPEITYPFVKKFSNFIPAKVLKDM
ncbi:MAG TPA: DNA alkylation repair protein, partial [Candidatus Hodarchaeales archaeon]|nr:DNA alkylation repair protein [Candidatus Hodarchaeales archaeon]